MLYSAVALQLKWLFVVSAGSRAQLKESSQEMSFSHGRRVRGPLQIGI